jgi:hypothetical protein
VCCACLLTSSTPLRTSNSHRRPPPPPSAVHTALMYSVSHCCLHRAANVSTNCSRGTLCRDRSDSRASQLEHVVVLRDLSRLQRAHTLLTMQDEEPARFELLCDTTRASVFLLATACLCLSYALCTQRSTFTALPSCVGRGRDREDSRKLFISIPRLSCCLHTL